MNDAGANSRAYVRAAAAVIALWVLLQIPLWLVPPFSDALGHHFPQAWLLLRSGWSFHAVAASNAVEHPPLISSMTAAAWTLTGVNTIVPHVISTLIGALALLGVFRLASLMTTPRRAFLSTTCLAANAVFFAQAGNPYIEIAVVAGLVWGVYFLLKNNAAGVCISLMFMSLAKETSLPLAGVVGLYVVWSSRRQLWRDTWPMLAAIVIATLPALGWLAYCASVKGSFMAASLHAATTNGSVASSPYGVVRKLALGWAQLLFLGLWVPLIGGLFLFAARPRVQWDKTTTSAHASLLVLLAVVSVTEHGVISIGLNRYYLPALALLWIVAWSRLPDLRVVARAVVAVTVFWGVFGYFSRVRYAGTDDNISGPRAALAHRALDRTVADEQPREPVLTSYPTTLEFQYPFLGYVRVPVPVRGLADSAAYAGIGGEAVVSDTQMDSKAFAIFLASRHAHPIAVEVYPGGTVRLLRFD